jgi:hypothetical protein
MGGSSKASTTSTTIDKKISTGGDGNQNIIATEGSNIWFETLDADLAAHNLSLMAGLSGDAIGATRSLAEDVLSAAGYAMADMKDFAEGSITSMKSLAEGTNSQAFGLTEKVLAINAGQNQGTQAMADNMLTTMRDFMGKLTGDESAQLSGSAAMTESSKSFFERNPIITVVLAGACLLGLLAFLFNRNRNTT